MNNHVCVLFCYLNIEHIIKCYESLKCTDIDFFIVENKSENSLEIKNYFLKENVVGYIQFEKNITYRAIEVFIRDYYCLLEKYDYITISDADLKIINQEETISEIIKNLKIGGIGVSCVDVCLSNFPYNIEGSENWIPMPLHINEDYIECATGIHLCTVKKENLYLLKETFIDSYILNLVYQNSLKWVKTIKNKAIHLTWDLYKKENEYFKFKINNYSLWDHNLTSTYKVLK